MECRCKRPCFHDDYLQVFNQDNVTLVDTEGKGVDRLTEHGVVVQGQEYPVDCLVLATGFRSPFIGSPGTKADVHVTGKNGQLLDEKWAAGVGTLHGVISEGFPNLFWPGISQAAIDGNFTHAADHLVRHISYILAQALKKGGSENVVVEPTKDAEEAWTGQILAGAMAFAPMMGCTPSYYNNEGEADKAATQEEQMKAGRAAMWSDGLISYLKVLDDWRAQGDMQGLQVTV
jgi:cation diffusion facilitator CzcD-associated flavoprotein CzcO